MVLGFTGTLPVALIGLLSIILLVYGAEIVVSKMEGVAKYYGVSEVVIAMTIVAIGTSLPELALHLIGSANILLSSQSPLQLFLVDPGVLMFGNHTEAANLLVQQGKITGAAAANSSEVFMGTSGAVLGANIGSDVVQQTLVLGLVIMSSALLADKHSFKFSEKFLIRDYAPMMGTTLMTLILALNWRGVISFLTGGPLTVSGTLTRLDGLVLVGSFIAYMLYLYTTRTEELASQGDVEASQRPLADFLIGIAAMGLVIGSAEVFLRVVEVAVAQTGLSESMIGVATVGIVSAFPEMITAISGLRHGSEGVSLGTLIGSNITNPLLAIGSGAIISTYAVPRPLVLWDLPMETVTAGLLLAYMFSKEKAGTKLAKPFKIIGLDSVARRLENTENRKLSIAGAFLLVLLYFVYIYVRFTYFQYDFAH
ncbi:sodium:calcium antiporter [Candidatus Nanohalococcus occultus]|uniref:Ca2 /Na antiporter n=1 Tax=Candidatus Nanohalococcus occultus TaxID=2978047 RepID=A0ABY8CED9_9ARCH|nr:Ca2 /Na antiporter [Candidatus Nanohaloarchaeota archaeon SVXNc]